MNFGFLTKGVEIPPKKLFAVTIATSGTFAWFFLFWLSFETIFSSLIASSLWVNIGEALFLSFGALSAIVGSEISKKINRRKLLFSWITLGVLVTVSLALFQGVFFVVLSSILLGVSLGLGIPSCGAFLADCTVVGERARVSGLLILETFLMVSFAIIVISILNLGLMGIILLCVVLRLTSYAAIFLDPCERPTGKELSWWAVWASKDFGYYLSPWLMFNIASGLIAFVWLGLSPEFVTALAIANPLHYGGAGIGGLVSGVVADRFGRKQPIIFGMILLGVSFALLGLSASPLTLIIYMAVSGFAWGFLLVVYLAVPGDLAFSGSKEKFYAFGVIIPLIIYMSIPGAADFLQITAPMNSLSSILSIILFLSVVPVLRAKETLPESWIRERELKEHVEKLGKLVQESQKNE